VHLATLIGLCLAAQEANTAEQMALAQAVRDAYVSNQGGFPFGQITFAYIKGYALDEASARRGELSPAYTAKCLYNYNGRSARYERIFPDDEMRAANKKIGDKITSVIDNFRLATNGELTLYDSVTFAENTRAHGTKLSPGTRVFDRDFQFPLSLGRPDHTGRQNLGKQLLDALQQSPNLQLKTVSGHLRYEGRDVVHIVLATPYGKNEYWVDVGRGAVPLKIVIRLTASQRRAAHQTVYYYDDLRLIANCGWLPFKESWWNSRDNQAGQILLREATFDKAPGEAAFAVGFPAPTSLVDEAKGIRYPPRTTWNVLDLPRGGSPGVQKVEYASMPRDQMPKLPGTVPARSRYDLLIYGAVGIALTTALILWRRRQTDD
jgi:hypothetical protein